MTVKSIKHPFARALEEKKPQKLTKNKQKDPPFMTLMLRMKMQIILKLNCKELLLKMKLLKLTGWSAFFYVFLA